MKKRKSVLTAAGMAVIAMLIIILTPPQTVASNNSGDDDDNFSWQEVAREMDAMPFSRAFIELGLALARKAQKGAQNAGL